MSTIPELERRAVNRRTGERRKVITKEAIQGASAVLGLDVVAFSTWHDEDQLDAVRHLMAAIDRSLKFHNVGERDFRWSPAGDGGYLTFGSNEACRCAVDVAFALCQQLKRPSWRARGGEKLEIRLALHIGPVQEAPELGGTTNIWGIGINTTARILAISAPSQLLVSRPYFDTYIRGQRESEFEVGVPHWRTAKHGQQIEVMNINRDGLCLSNEEASARQWHAVGTLWRKTVSEYTTLIDDTMRSRDPIVAIAAAKFLLELEEIKAVRDLCEMLGSSSRKPDVVYPHQTHPLFSQMPPSVLFEVIEQASPRHFAAGEVICEQGDAALSCYFPVSGTIVVDVPGIDQPIPVAKGQIIGEFSLWVPNLSRTATVRALEEGLILEVRNDRLGKALGRSPQVEQIVFGIVKQRITENILQSKRLFPGIDTTFWTGLDGVETRCELHDPGSELDLESWTHILFSGTLRIAPPNAKPLEIRGAEVFGSERVVGIASAIGSPDGAIATVLEEAVTVALPRENLRELQTTFPEMGNAWNAICGERLGELHE